MSERNRLARIPGIPRLLACATLVASGAYAMQQNDPPEPPRNLPTMKMPKRPGGDIDRRTVDEAGMRALVESLVRCGTRLTLSSWDDPARGVGCGRDRIVERLQAIAAATGGKLEVVVDRFEATSARTDGKPAHLENVYAILHGQDPQLAKTLFIVSGHFDSRPSDVMDASADAPGADDDASGVAVSVESARLLARAASASAAGRASVLFAAVSGEEQGLLGSTHLVDWARDHGYRVGGMLDDDIVGSDPAPGAPHRVRLFSGNGDVDDADSSSRELARLIEEIDGRDAVRLVFRLDRFGRGGDHYPFWKAGLPAVRFTEPLEIYDHQHQTPRVENGVDYGDYLKFLDYHFMGNVARDNAEALRQLALAPAPPDDAVLTGAVTPDAKIAWHAAADAERAGFEILWRETTEARWQVLTAVAQPGEVVLSGVSTDNHFFAVRSVGRNGARSIAVPAVAERRPIPGSTSK